MSDKQTDYSFRRQADERFSVTPLQDAINARFEEPVHDTYTEKELIELARFASRSLRQQVSKHDVYGGDVFVVTEEDDFMYHVEPDGAQTKVAYDADVMIHGYVRDFKVRTMLGEERKALFAMVEEYFDDTTDTQTYHVPIAIEGSNRAAQLRDAPVPVAESDGEIVLDDVYAHNMYLQDSEQAEQDVQWSLLNIIEQDLFDAEDGVCSTQALCEYVQSMVEEQFIDDIDDFATACNYYFAKCAHDGDPWLLEVEGDMEWVDGYAGEIITPEWVTEKVLIKAIDLNLDENHRVSMTVLCTKDIEESARIYRRRAVEHENWGFVRQDDETEDS